MGLSTDAILGKVVELARGCESAMAKSLDIGAGSGILISLLRQNHPGLETYACDYTESLMNVPDQKVDIANLNDEVLPYPAATFDLVTCTEVVEHLENYHRLIREIYRVMKPGGMAIFTTPNILNLQSRVRFLFFGFWNLFGPIPVGRAETYSTIGHIMPVSYFYLAHALAEAGFTLGPLEIDRPQRAAMPKFLILWPFVALFGFFAKRREIRKFKTIDHTNLSIVENLNSVKMLLGRTIVVVARVPAVVTASKTR